ncbi:Two-component response regulator, AmiR/NasT family, consists of REC and RNA-binding antiterminator (ANTAR) domains [Roseateles sp. YR242]|uniref:ANTAR domain-containing response regulator n=1 Tax=Roseateles sp. YR242 TaxID=1855305 RepID=UPI0008C3676E|nr:ANTAR domain-containing protein [Roseateles sp. YR242]SEK63619.1 Two-component response regulator, AmiR/NasT family, consists of REC and RNA-binding antiterminator (ANTAR) domains [Roseateles sp. YR242]
MSSSLRRLYEDLRRIDVAVVYPAGEDREVIVRQLERIGCRIRVIWPMPAEAPAGADVILFRVSEELEGTPWTSATISATLIALSDYESPTTLKVLLDTQAHGVITKPFRSFGILSTLVLARSSHSFHKRQQGKIEKLESTIKLRRQLEKAIRTLVEHRQMTEPQAYEHMRMRATSLRITVAEVATMLIEAQEAMDKLGLSSSER